MHEAVITHLLQTINCPAASPQIIEWHSGANNRNYLVRASGKKFMAKEYFLHPADLRDRFTAELRFNQFANAVSPGVAPKLYASDANARVNLFEYIEGQSFSPQTITLDHINKAIDFFCALNHKNNQLVSGDLFSASEVCFSISDHLRHIGDRLNQLSGVAAITDEEIELQLLVKQMRDLWMDLKLSVMSTSFYKKHNSLKENQRCLSPSDFGFHNALKKACGSIVFFDFEYAGWDDPAKMACDFFSQVNVPISVKYFDFFLKKTMSVFPNADQLIERAYLLKPLYSLKWCCIILNVFLPQHLARRVFANGRMDITAHKRTQLKRAQSLLEKSYG